MYNQFKIKKLCITNIKRKLLADNWLEADWMKLQQNVLHYFYLVSSFCDGWIDANKIRSDIGGHICIREVLYTRISVPILDLGIMWIQLSISSYNET